MKNRTVLARVALAALFTSAMGLTACDMDKLLEVTDRDRVTEETLNDSAAVLDIVVAEGMNDFTRGYGGSGLTDSYVANVAAMSDEMFSSGTFPTRTATDRRASQPPSLGNTSDAAYTQLQFARRSLKDAAATVEAVEGTSDPRFAELKALEAYTVVALGEGFCSAVPLSSVDADGIPEYGQPMTSSELFNAAISLFDTSLGGSNTELAAIGKARALLDLGQYDAAAAAVAGVDSSFVYYIYYSESGASNPIYSLQSNGRWSQSDREGAWNSTTEEYEGAGLPFRSAGDPRTQWTENPNGGFDHSYRLFVTERATSSSYDDPIVLASGVEARLIQAEARLQSGDYPGMVAILNGLRQNVSYYMDLLIPGYVTNSTLADLAAPADADAARDMLFSERGFWLFLTGHRLGDLRREIYQYNHDAYPSGSYHKGGNFGTDVVFPLDFDEANNPNFSLDMCDVKSASIS